MPKKLIVMAVCLSLLSLSLPFFRPAAQGRQLRSEISFQLRHQTIHADFGRPIGFSALAQNPSFAGSFEVADCNSISGWAEDANNLNTSVHVNFFVGSTLVATALANLPRNDVGAHGFNIPTPNALKDTQARTISARVESSTGDILNSPRSMGPCLTSRDDVGTAVRLNVALKINNGAASTKGRLASLNFSATQATGANNQDVTSQVTHYRVRESPDLSDASLSAQPWLPLEHALIQELALHNGAGQRFGERKIMFQVKIGNLESNVVSDTITLEPVLKEYRISASGNGHPLIQFAASQGFKFPLSFYTTCDGSCAGNISADSNLASGGASFSVQANTGGGGGGGADPSHGLNCGTEIVSGTALGASGGALVGAIAGAGVGAAIGAGVGAAVGLGVGGLTCALTSLPPSAPGTKGICSTKVDYLLFEGRSPNQFWRIKSVDVPGAFVRFHGANRFLVKFHTDNKEAFCGQKQIAIGDVVVEGPEADDFVDPANPWKNAFVFPIAIKLPQSPGQIVTPPRVPRPQN